MLKIEDVKKLLEKSNIKHKEIENGIVIFKEEEFNHLFQIKQILVTFGISDEDLEQSAEGTIISAKQYDAQKLKMLLSPFYDLEKMEVIDTYHLLVKDLIIDTLNEDEGEVADGSADDLGEVPTDGGASEGFTIEDLASKIDATFPNSDVLIVDDKTIELPATDEMIDYIKSLEDDLKDFDVEITDDKITIKG